MDETFRSTEYMEFASGQMLVDPVAEWCTCDEDRMEDAVYFDDDLCPCGIGKHHYHDPVCGRVLQVG